MAVRRMDVARRWVARACCRSVTHSQAKSYEQEAPHRGHRAPSALIGHAGRRYPIQTYSFVCLIMWHYLSYDTAFWISMATMALVFIGGLVWMFWGAKKHSFTGTSVAGRSQVSGSHSLRAPRLRLMHLQRSLGDVVVQAVNIGGPAQRPTVTCEAAEEVEVQPNCAWHAGGRVRLTFGFLSSPGPFQFTLQYQDQLGAHHTQAYEVGPSERHLEPLSVEAAAGRPL